MLLLNLAKYATLNAASAGGLQIQIVLTVIRHNSTIHRQQHASLDAPLLINILITVQALSPVLHVLLSALLASDL